MFFDPHTWLAQFSGTLMQKKLNYLIVLKPVRSSIAISAWYLMNNVWFPYSMVVTSNNKKCPFQNIRSKLTAVFMACKFMTFVGTTSLKVALHVLGFDALRVFRICASSMCANAIAAPPHGNINVTTQAIKDRGFLCACIVFFELKNIRKSIIGWLRLSLPLLGQKNAFGSI